MNNFKISVICELNRFDYPVDVSFQLTRKAYEMVKDFDNAEVQVVIVGKRMSYDNIINDFSLCGADKVIVVNDDRLEEYAPSLYTKAVAETIRKEMPNVVLFGATITGRELAPLVASEMQTGLTADCTDLCINENMQLEATRPTYGGKMNAVILCKTLPQMATVRPDVFKKPEDNVIKTTKADFSWVDVSSEKDLTKILEIIPRYSFENCNLTKAKLIFAGGRGLKTKENFNKLYELARLAEGYVGASRGAVDAGFASKELQIGQTGVNVNAKIYIAFGISGMAQHLAGINSCDKIIAVNNDADAPIFKYADIGIVADAVEVIEKMTENLR